MTTHTSLSSFCGAEGAVLPAAHYAQVTVDLCVFILHPAHETNQPEIAMFSVLV